MAYKVIGKATATADSAANTSINDVVGNKSDKSFSNGSSTPSLAGHLKANYYYVHSPAKVYPTLADSITLTADASGWTLGAKAEVIPADTITTKFDIHWILVSEISAVDEYELVVYKGAGGAEEEIGRIAFNRSSTFSQEGDLPIQIAPQSANTRISMALACKSTNARTCNVKVYYHTYPDIT